MSEKKPFFAWNWKRILLIIWQLIFGLGVIVTLIVSIFTIVYFVLSDVFAQKEYKESVYFQDDWLYYTKL